jgi:hypothetical protein
MYYVDTCPDASDSERGTGLVGFAPRPEVQLGGAGASASSAAASLEFSVRLCSAAMCSVQDAVRIARLIHRIALDLQANVSDFHCVVAAVSDHSKVHCTCPSDLMSAPFSDSPSASGSSPRSPRVMFSVSSAVPSSNVSPSLPPVEAELSPPSGFKWGFRSMDGEGCINVTTSDHSDIRSGSQILEINGETVRHQQEFGALLRRYGQDPRCEYVEVVMRDPRNRQQMRRWLHKEDAMRSAIQAEWSRLPLQTTDEILRIDEFLFSKNLNELDRGVDWLDCGRSLDVSEALESARLRLMRVINQRSSRAPHAQSQLAEDEAVIRIIVVRQKKKYCLQLLPVAQQAEQPDPAADQAASLNASAGVKQPDILRFPGITLRVMQLIDGSASASISTRDDALMAAIGGMLRTPLSASTHASPEVDRKAQLVSSSSAGDVAIPIDELGGLRLLACGNHPAVVCSGVCSLCRSTLCWRCLCQGEHAHAGKILCSECLQHHRLQRRLSQRFTETNLVLLVFFLVCVSAGGLVLIFAFSGTSTNAAGILLMLVVYLLAGNLLIPSTLAYWKEYPSESSQASPWRWSNNISFGDAKKQVQAIAGR